MVDDWPTVNHELAAATHPQQKCHQHPNYHKGTLTDVLPDGRMHRMFVTQQWVISAGHLLMHCHGDKDEDADVHNERQLTADVSMLSDNL